MSDTQEVLSFEFTRETLEEIGSSRLDKLSSTLFPQFSRTRIQRLIESGAVTLNDEIVPGKTKVKPGDLLEIEVPPLENPEPKAEEIPLNVVFEDDHLIVINKPAGMVVHPAPGHSTGTLVNALLFHCGKSLKGIGGVSRPGIVHRLDKGTTGILVAAKTEKTHQALCDLFKDHQIHRVYHALCAGTLEPPSGSFSESIGRHPVYRKKMAAAVKNGKRAVTHYQTLEGFRSATYIELRLETGRTHQIRVHLSYHGRPLIGDPLYGSGIRPQNQKSPRLFSALKEFKRPCLHAKELGFTHPVTKEDLYFKSELPADFKELLEAYQKWDEIS